MSTMDSQSFVSCSGARTRKRKVLGGLLTRFRLSLSSSSSAASTQDSLTAPSLLSIDLDESHHSHRGLRRRVSSTWSGATARSMRRPSTPSLLASGTIGDTVSSSSSSASSRMSFGFTRRKSLMGFPSEFVSHSRRPSSMLDRTPDLEKQLMEQQHQYYSRPMSSMSMYSSVQKVKRKPVPSLLSLDISSTLEDLHVEGISPCVVEQDRDEYVKLDNVSQGVRPREWIVSDYPTIAGVVHASTASAIHEPQLPAFEDRRKGTASPATEAEGTLSTTGDLNHTTPTLPSPPSLPSSLHLPTLEHDDEPFEAQFPESFMARKSSASSSTVVSQNRSTRVLCDGPTFFITPGDGRHTYVGLPKEHIRNKSLDQWTGMPWSDVKDTILKPDVVDITLP